MRTKRSNEGNKGSSPTPGINPINKRQNRYRDRDAYNLNKVELNNER